MNSSARKRKMSKEQRKIQQFHCDLCMLLTRFDQGKNVGCSCSPWSHREISMASSLGFSSIFV